ncbi:MAG TPA: hypothetical protein PLP88_02940 [Bacteroidales bacterium]|nr:hypothetical protein [Bacteroidales bacterium]
MNKRLVLLPAILIMVSMHTFSQEVNFEKSTSQFTNFRNIYKFSLTEFTRNTFQMGYERFLSPSTSIYFIAGLTSKDDYYDNVFGIKTEAQLKIHAYTSAKGKVMHRLYFAPYIMNHYLDTEFITWEYDPNWNSQEVKISDSFDVIGTGVMFGWSFSFAKRMNIDVFTGGGIRRAIGSGDESNDGVWDYSYSGITPRFGIDVGFLF